MRTRRTIALIILLAVAGCAFTFYLLLPHEPVSEGKPMSFWVDQYHTSVWGKPDKELQTQSENALRRISTQARPLLLKKLAARESKFRIWLIAHVPSAWFKTFHILNLNQYRAQIDAYRISGADGLAALGPEAKPVVPDLIAMLNDKDKRVRYLTVFTLRCLGPVAKEALPSLITLIDDPDFAIRSDSITALGTIQAEPERVIPILVEYVKKHTNEAILCEDAINALGRFGPQARSSVPVLVGILNGGNQTFRPDAARCLGRIGPAAEDAIPMLLKCLGDPDADVRTGATVALGEIGAKPAILIPALIERLDESHRSKNNYPLTISYLGSFGSQSKAALPRIIELLNDPDQNIRATATNALKKIDPEAAAKAAIK